MCLGKLEVDDLLTPSKLVLIKEPVLPPCKKVLNDWVGRREVLLYNIYYLFTTVNKNSPFVLPHPFTSIRK